MRPRCCARCCRASITWCSPAWRNPRALPPATLMSLAEKLAPAVPAEAAADPRAALERARAVAGPGGAVLATGSIYLIADLLREDPDARASTL